MQCSFPLHLFLLLCLPGPALSLGLRICAFNIKSFGESKAGKPRVMHNIVRILSRGDVFLLQEVRDAKQVAVNKLLASLNRYDENNQYDYVASERLGRTSAYQEQYVFIYRKGSVTLLDQLQYPDDQKGDEDVFSRPPFVVRIKAPKTVIKEVALIGVHTAPRNATKEIDELYDVFQYVKEKWDMENVLFLGDLNAACGYVAKRDKKNIRASEPNGFFWLIGDDVDTTVLGSTNCAYDRFIAYGRTFLKAIIPGSPGVFPFDKKFHLTEEQALETSDHYPICLDLKSSARQSQATLSVIFIAVCILFLSLA